MSNSLGTRWDLHLGLYSSWTSANNLYLFTLLTLSLNTSSSYSPLQLATILDKINGNPRPPLPPPDKSRMGKWRVFALRAASSLIWGGWGFAVPFYFVQDCSQIAAVFIIKRPVMFELTNRGIKITVDSVRVMF